ncbi:MAG: hypothetical protein Q7S38_01795 [bacterium]|nr:hypothetical protein [bacterium]
MLRERQPELPVGKAMYAKRGASILVFERKKPHFEAQVIRIGKTPQPGNARVLVETSDGSRIYLGGGTSVLG